MPQTFTNSGTFDGLDATLQVTVPNAADDDFTTTIQLSQNGIEPEINIAFAIDRSGSAGNDTGIDFDGDGVDDTFLEAQVYALQEKLDALVAAGYDPATVSVTIVDYGSSANSFTATLDDIDALNAYASGLTTGGSTNYADALSEIEDAWDAQGVGSDETNIVYFYSDGFPFPADQDYQTPLDSLEAAYGPQVSSVGFGPNSAEDDLDAIDSGGDASIVTTRQELLDLLDTPPPLPDVGSFDIVVDGVVVDTIPSDDPRVIVSPTGLTVLDLDVSGYVTADDTPQTLNLQVVTNFTNGETLTTTGTLPIYDGVIEGTAGGDLIDVDYMDDPEGDRVDAEDNVSPGASGASLDDDVIFGLGGNDTIEAGAADDEADGGAGNDEVFGEDGNDTLRGGADNDLLVGGAGDDEMHGDAGDDTLDAGDDPGIDIGFGGDDADVFRGFGEGDTVTGGEGGTDNDSLDLTGRVDFRIVYDPNDPSFDPTSGTGEAGQVIFFSDATRTTETGRLTFSQIDSVIPCFTPGAMIATPTGEVPVETIRPGDEVLTRDNGIQEVHWVGKRVLERGDLARSPHLRPILIHAGSLGNGLPERDLLVSPQHRMLIAGERPQLYFEDSEVLVAAKHLINNSSIVQLHTLRATYVHFMCKRHEVVLANGSWTESFQPGDVSLSGVDEAQRREIFELFPELGDADGLGAYTAARRSLKAHEARLLR